MKPDLYTCFTAKGPMYCYMLTWNCNNRLFEHLNGKFFTLFINMKKIRNLSISRMLSERSVVIDVEGFRYKKNAAVVKELAKILSDYSDRIIVLPPVNFTKAQTKSLQPVNKLFTRPPFGKR